MFHFSGQGAARFLPPWLALAPALLLSAAALYYNRFMLEDDAISVLTARIPVSHFFRSDGTGRFIPFHWISHWLTFRLLPEAPWSLTLCNAGYLLAAAALVYALARGLAGSGAGILAAWFFTLNLATVENLFTLSKNENGQLPFWLLALLLLTRVARPGGRPTPRWAWPLFAFAVLSACLFKETGVLLGAPLGVALVVALGGRPAALSAAECRRTAAFAAVGLAAICVALVPIYLRNRDSGTYFNRTVVPTSGGLLSRFHHLEMFNRDWMLATLVVGGLAAGVALAVCSTGARRIGAALLTVQLAVFTGFFGLVAYAYAYYLYAGAALAAVLLGAAVARLWRMGGVTRGAALAAFVLLGVWGGQRTAAGVGALSGFSHIEDRMTAAVVAQKPVRLLFYLSGTRATHFHARYTWNDLHRIGVQLALLDFPPVVDPEFPHLTMRDLQPGDWIVEQFAPPVNAANPLRGIGLVRLEQHGLIDPAGHTLAPVEIIQDIRVTYPAFVNRPVLGFLPPSYIRSRIYRVTGTPQVSFEGLDADGWMREEATLWVNAARAEPVTLRATAFAPDERWREMRLAVLAGGRPAADCPVGAEGRVICNFSPATAGAPAEAGWWRFTLRGGPARAPQELGISADPRKLSFNFTPTFEAGLARLASP